MSDATDRLILVLLAAVLVAAPPARAAAAPQVLVVSEAVGFVHPSIPAARAALARLGARSNTYDVRLLRRARDLTAARLRQARAVVLLSTTGDIPLGRGGRTRLLRFVRAGGGLAALHAASNAFPSWRAFGPLLGARFKRHPAFTTDRVVITDPAHPAVADVPASFSTADEFYEFKTSPRRRAHVLARRAGPVDRPLVWCRAEHRGRVFSDALGHPDAAWADGDVRLTLVDSGLRWVVGTGPPGCAPDA